MLPILSGPVLRRPGRSTCRGTTGFRHCVHSASCYGRCLTSSWQQIGLQLVDRLVLTKRHTEHVHGKALRLLSQESVSP